jgi:hypothetical protein
MISKETLEKLCDIIGKVVNSRKPNICCYSDIIQSLLASGEVVLKNDVQELVDAFSWLIEGAELYDENEDCINFTDWDCFTRGKQALAKFKGASDAGN